MSGSGPWTETQTSAQAVIGCSDPPSPSKHHGWCQEGSWHTGSSAESRNRCWNQAANCEAKSKGQRWRMPGIPDVSRTHSEDLLWRVAETSHKVGHRFNHFSLVCILNTKCYFHSVNHISAAVVALRLQPWWEVKILSNNNLTLTQ